MRTIYCCDVCGKTFKTEAEAKEHEELHIQKEEASKKLLKQMKEAEDGMISAYNTYREKLNEYEKLKEKYYALYGQSYSTLKDLINEIFGGK